MVLRKELLNADFLLKLQPGIAAFRNVILDDSNQAILGFAEVRLDDLDQILEEMAQFFQDRSFFYFDLEMQVATQFSENEFLRAGVFELGSRKNVPVISFSNKTILVDQKFTFFIYSECDDFLVLFCTDGELFTRIQNHLDAIFGSVDNDILLHPNEIEKEFFEGMVKRTRMSS